MAHYFTDNKDLPHDYRQFEYYFDNELFRFNTDNGVFSKKNIDYGSVALIKTINSYDLGKKALDLGCGYGPIGIILARFHPDTTFSMVDVNSRAIELARKNIKENNCHIEAYKLEDITLLEDKFATIILNPPIRAGKKVIYDLYDKSKEMLTDKGHFYIVIRKDHGGPTSMKKLETIFNEVKVINKDKGYLIIDSHN